MNARAESIRWAQELMQNGFVVLDTETTGLHRGEIVQIAIVDSSGQTLLDTLVKPVGDIPYDASQIHGITAETVRNAPGWGDVWERVKRLCAGRRVVIYNAQYDLRLIVQSCKAANVNAESDWGEVSCAMLEYAAFHGEWDEYHGNYRWQRLTAACAQLDITGIDAPAHSAIGDCLRTLAVVRAMAATAGEASHE